MPFLQEMLDDFKIVPIVAGDATPEQVSQVIDALWGGDETLIVISSDLSHYHDYATAKRLDQATSEAIEHLQYERLASDRRARSSDPRSVELVPLGKPGGSWARGGAAGQKRVHIVVDDQGRDAWSPSAARSLPPRRDCHRMLRGAVRPHASTGACAGAPRSPSGSCTRRGWPAAPVPTASSASPAASSAPSASTASVPSGPAAEISSSEATVRAFEPPPEKCGAGAAAARTTSPKMLLPARAVRLDQGEGLCAVLEDGTAACWGTHAFGASPTRAPGRGGAHPERGRRRCDECKRGAGVLPSAQRDRVRGREQLRARRSEATRGRRGAVAHGGS